MYLTHKRFAKRRVFYVRLSYLLGYYSLSEASGSISLTLDNADLNFFLFPFSALSDKYFSVVKADIFSANAVATALLQKLRKAREMSLKGLIMRCRSRIVFQ